MIQGFVRSNKTRAAKISATRIMQFATMNICLINCLQVWTLSIRPSFSAYESLTPTVARVYCIVHSLYKRTRLSVGPLEGQTRVEFLRNGISGPSLDKRSWALSNLNLWKTIQRQLLEHALRAHLMSELGLTCFLVQRISISSWQKFPMICSSFHIK